MRRPIVINRRFAVQVGFLFAVAIASTIHQDSLRKWQLTMSASQQKSQALTDRQQSERSRSKEAEKQSEIAMSIVKSGCTPIVLTQNNNEARFQEDMRVFDSQTFPKNPKTPRFDASGNPINGVKYLPPGIPVCNRFGDAAKIGADGLLTEIVRVEPSKLVEFQGYFKNLKQVVR